MTGLISRLHSRTSPCRWRDHVYGPRDLGLGGHATDQDELLELVEVGSGEIPA
jgi:hypothetical protein